jgi:hypothetical protein
MSIKQKVNGVVSDYIIHASDVQLLDVNDNFTSTTVEGALKENLNKIGDLNGNGLTETNLATAIKNDRTQISEKVNQSDLNTINNNLVNKADITYVDTKISSITSSSPKPVSLVANMTDTTKTYVYTGSENGYTSGNWYYYNGSAWTSGGVYQATALGDGMILSKNLNSRLANKLLELDDLAVLSTTTESAYQFGVLKSNITVGIINYFDVSSESAVKITGTFDQWYDVYTLLDSNGNTLSYYYNQVSNLSYNSWIDCSGATKLAVSNSSTYSGTLTVQTYEGKTIQDNSIELSKLTSNAKKSVFKIALL